MINCQTFRSTFRLEVEDAATLAHVRACDACLDYAVSIDPDYFFRSLGGEDLVPPGGVDAFVADVMAQVRVRSAETSSMPRLSTNRYLRAAAAVLFVIAGTTGIYRFNQQPAPRPESVIATGHVAQATVQAPLATKAVVESYQSRNATIVELPNTSANDVKVVMIYDESLPADL